MMAQGGDRATQTKQRSKKAFYCYLSVLQKFHGEINVSIRKNT